MGIFGSKTHREYVYLPAPDINPDPTKWHAIAVSQVGNFCVLKVRYPNCTNREGLKIMVFEATWKRIKAQQKIDPHFGDGAELIYPIARFEPTEQGWIDALRYAAMKNELPPGDLE